MPPQTGPMSLADIQNTPPMQSQAPSLGALAQSMPQGNIPAPHHSKFNLGNIAGVLGDAFSAYGGKQPTFGPFLQAEQMRKQEQDFEMQKFNNELALKMYMMRNGGMETDVGKKLMGEGIYPGDPRWVTAMQTSANNDLDPVVTTPQGLMLRSQITGAMAGAPAPQGVTFTPIGGN